MYYWKHEVNWLSSLCIYCLAGASYIWLYKMYPQYSLMCAQCRKNCHESLVALSQNFQTLLIFYLHSVTKFWNLILLTSIFNPWLYFIQTFYSANSVTDNLEENLGNEFSDSSSLKLIDVLGDEITDSVIPMGKKVRLELSIDGSNYIFIHLIFEFSSYTLSWLIAVLKLALNTNQSR